MIDTPYETVVARLRAAADRTEADAQLFRDALAALERLGPRPAPNTAAAAKPARRTISPDGTTPCQFCGRPCAAKGWLSHERCCAANPNRGGVPCAKGCGATFGHGPGRASHERTCTGQPAGEQPPAVVEARAAVERSGLVRPAAAPPGAAGPDHPTRPAAAPLDCEHCGRSFDRRSKLDAHSRACARITGPATAHAVNGRTVMYAGRDAEKLTLAPGGYECDDCGHQADTVVALDGHVRRTHDRDLHPAERHRVIKAASA